jgi:hypothetical protein
MSKFLLNLLLQISKALVNSKIQFLIQKFFFLTFGLAPAGLPSPACQSPQAGPIRSARVSIAYLRKYVFPFGSRLLSLPPLPRLSVKRASAVSSIPHLQPPELARAATALRPPRAAQLRASGAAEPLPPHLHSLPLNSPLNPPPPPVFNGVKAINAGVKPRPPLPALPRPL